MIYANVAYAFLSKEDLYSSFVPQITTVGFTFAALTIAQVVM